MSRGPQTFREADVTRAVRAVRKAGIEVQRVEVDRTGKVVVVVAKQEENRASAQRNECDEL